MSFATPVADRKSTSKEYVFKIIVVGEYSVGKTAVIRRYTQGQFDAMYRLTVGIDFHIKELAWTEDIKIKLQLWDIAGHERFQSMTRVYYNKAMAAIIIYDITRPESFDVVTRWLDDVHEKVLWADGSPVPVMIMANKCDKPSSHMKADLLNSFCRQNKVLCWFPTSAKDDINIDIAMDILVRHLVTVADAWQQEYGVVSADFVGVPEAEQEDEQGDIAEADLEQTKRKQSIALHDNTAANATQEDSSCCDIA